MTYRVQSMLPDHLKDAIALWKTSPGVGLNESDEPDVLQRFLQRNPGLSQIATVDGKIVGAVLCGHDGRRGFLYHLAVATSYRRQGIGRALAESCFEQLRAEGVAKCNIFLYTHNSDGRAFWERESWAVRTDLCILQKLTAPPTP